MILYYIMILLLVKEMTIQLSKQQAIDADPKAI